MTLAQLLLVLATHFGADYLGQPEWQRQTKWRWGRGLWCHGLTYASALGAAAAIAGLPCWWPILNGGAHVAIDAVTSRWAKRLLLEDRFPAAVNVHGLDQLCHVSLLIGTVLP